MVIKKSELGKVGELFIEDLADLEHRQWCHIIEYLLSLDKNKLEEKLLYYKDLVKIEYKDLPEEKKELDRIWAREVLKCQWNSAEKEIERRSKK